MKKISIYSRSYSICPASYYRINQYTNYLRDSFVIKNRCALTDLLYSKYLISKHKCKCIYVIYALCTYLYIYIRTIFHLLSDIFIYSPDVVFICRTIIPQKIFFIHRLLLSVLLRRSFVIWDFDDNIFETGEIPQIEKQIIEKNVNKVIVTNHYLRNLLSELDDDKFLILPTTDGDVYKHFDETLFENRLRLFEREIVLIWVASASNLVYIESIIPYLEKTAKIINERYHKTLTLKVVCNVPLKCSVSHLRIVNFLWNRDVAIEEMKFSHIGLMPLKDNSFTRGKGGFKLIQYMSIALPVIASSVGFNIDIVNDNVGDLIKIDKTDWCDSIIKYANNWSLLKQKSYNARKHWLHNFSFENNLNILRRIFDGR